MAKKPHKFAGNGLDADTALRVEQVANMAERAATECTGDVLHGMHKIISHRTGLEEIEFRITDGQASFKHNLIFFVRLRTVGDRSRISVTISWYLTAQPTVGGFFPAGAKRLVAHGTFLEFVRNLADQIRAADASASVVIRDGGPTIDAPPVALLPAGEITIPGSTPGARAGAATAMASSSSNWNAVSAKSQLSPPPPPRAAPPIQPPPNQAPTALLAPPPPPPVAVAAPPAAPRANSSGPVLPPPPGLVTGIPGAPPPSAAVPVSLPPRPTTVPPVVAPPVILQPAELDDDVDDATRFLGAPRNWVLTLPDNDSVDIHTSVVVGRDPSATSHDPGAVLVPLPDTTRSASKTHASLVVRNGLLWVTDLHSTNGTTVVGPAGERHLLVPGVPTPVDDRWAVLLGRYRIVVSKSAG